jgi:hypothetical protein
MADPLLERRLIEAMAKHLPPSASLLRLLDVEGRAGAILSENRADLDVIKVTGSPDTWGLDAGSLDAIAAYDGSPELPLLQVSLAALRAGGRLIIVQPDGNVTEALVKRLEGAGYTRILVEPCIEHPLVGVLMRGEKPHTAERTTDRIQQIASRDNAPRSGRYVHLLIQQKPNKPAWAIKPDEPVEWQAVAVAGDNETVLLAFSSLPKAVEFMQPAVLDGLIKDINKVAKFSWEIARKWPFPILMNPTDDILATNPIMMLPIDPATAESPDE